VSERKPIICWHRTLVA